MVSRRTFLQSGTALLAAAGSPPLHAHNVVKDSPAGPVLDPIRLDLDAVQAWAELQPRFEIPRDAGAYDRTADRLHNHLREAVDGAPWMPFHQILGISGYARWFTHQDEMVWLLAQARDVLRRGPLFGRASEISLLLDDWILTDIGEKPPFRPVGYVANVGTPREFYEVPPALRGRSAGNPAGLLGIYSLWRTLSREQTLSGSDAEGFWERAWDRLHPALKREAPADPEIVTEAFNGDLAGLLAGWRMAKMLDRTTEAALILNRLAAHLERRINLERRGVPLVQPDPRATKNLHAFGLPRFQSLVPEVAEALRLWAGDALVPRFRVLREERNAWHLAWGDRMIGGENFTNPRGFSRALFTAAAQIEALPAENLHSWIDVPWCRADWYFVEACCLAMWASAGRLWQRLTL